MTPRSALRQHARNTLRGRELQPILAVLILFAAIWAIQDCARSFDAVFESIGVLVAFFVMPNLCYGFNVGMLRLAAGRESTVKEMFGAGFTERYGRVLAQALLTTIYVLLWSLLLLIPGIVKAYSYALTYYIAEEHPELAPDTCIERSMAMMRGHKWELFMLHLSFLGWWLVAFILGVFTFGIGLIVGMLWLIPWMKMAEVQFYEQLKQSRSAAVVGQ